MKLYPIEAGNFKLDGGAMFGVVPKSLWSRTNPADANNLIDMAARCLLIESGNRLTLIDTGLGDKQSEKFFGHYHLWGEHSLDSSLKAAGFHLDEITDVFMTHLHFDHCGGSVKWNSDRTGYEPAFPNATYWTNHDHWIWATEPNPRERASFLPENLWPLQESGQLKFVEPLSRSPVHLENFGFDILFVDGHTDKQMIPLIPYKGKTLVYMADLLPTTGHIPLPYIMGYDTRPLITLAEKAEFMEEAARGEYYLFLEHDAHHEVCTVHKTEKGIRLKAALNFDEIF